MLRELIYQSLLDRFSATGSYKVASRRLQFVEDMGAEYLPAIFQNQTNESPKQMTEAGIVAWSFDVDLYVYAFQPDTNSPSTTILNPLLDAITDVFEEDNQYGGQLRIPYTDDNGPQELVCELAINGGIKVWEGILGQKAVAIVPVRVLVPAT